VTDANGIPFACSLLVGLSTYKFYLKIISQKPKSKGSLYVCRTHSLKLKLLHNVIVRLGLSTVSAASHHILPFNDIPFVCTTTMYDGRSL